MRVARAQSVVSILAEGDRYILDIGSVNYALRAMRIDWELERGTARHAPWLSPDIRSSANPSSETFTIPGVHPTQLEASQLLSHVDPTILNLVSSSEQKLSWQSQSSSNNEYNATASPAFAMVPQAFSSAQEVHTRDQAELPQSIQHEHGEFQNNFLDISYGPQPSVPGSLSIDPSAPQATAWAHNQLSHREDNVASPGTVTSQQTEIQHTTAPDDVEVGELPEFNRKPDSVGELLELELDAAFSKPYQYGRPSEHDERGESQW